MHMNQDSSANKQEMTDFLKQKAFEVFLPKIKVDSAMRLGFFHAMNDLDLNALQSKLNTYVNGFENVIIIEKHPSQVVPGMMTIFIKVKDLPEKILANYVTLIKIKEG